MKGGSCPGRGWGFLFTTASRPTLGPTQPPIQLVPGPLFLGEERPRCEADNSSPSSAEVKNAWRYTSTPAIRLHSVVLRAQGQLLPLPLPYTYNSSKIWFIHSLNVLCSTEKCLYWFVIWGLSEYCQIPWMSKVLLLWLTRYRLRDYAANLCLWGFEALQLILERGFLKAT
jgi:hypothetical protein